METTICESTNIGAVDNSKKGNSQMYTSRSI